MGGQYSLSFDELTITPPECTATLTTSGYLDIHSQQPLDCAMFGYAQFFIAAFKVYFALLMPGVVSGCLADSYRISRGSVHDSKHDEMFRKTLGRIRQQWERFDDERVGEISLLRVKDVLEGAGFKGVENRLVRSSLQILLRTRREQVTKPAQTLKSEGYECPCSLHVAVKQVVWLGARAGYPLPLWECMLVHREDATLGRTSVGRTSVGRTQLSWRNKLGAFCAAKSRADIFQS